MASRSPLEQLRYHLLASLGVAPALLLACSGEPPSADEGGVTTNPSSSATTIDGGNEGDADGTTTGGMSVPPNPTTTSASTSASTGDPDPSGDGDPGDGDGDGDGGVKLDVAPEPDLPPLGDCTVMQADPTVLDEYPDCPIMLDDGICWSNLYWGCIEPEPDQTCAEACRGGSCVADWSNCAGDMVFEFPSEVCGPYQVDGMCCSLAEIGEFCGSDGRPFVVAGVARVACLHAGPRAGDGSRLPERVRERLAAHWAEVAQAEHASIASFAQFGARLLAIGAPASMVRDALAAAGDEVRHAELARELASRYRGRELVFGALDTSGAASPSESFADTVLACVREGCIGETLAALELHTLARDCVDASLAESLRAVAADEMRHAALAWRFVQWALGRAPSLASRVAAVFERGVAASCEVETLDASERAWLRAHGCLPTDERVELEREGLRELVRPCAAVLLGSRTKHAQLLASDGLARLWAGHA